MNDSIACDVCVIGGGAAGLTVAKHLATAGREVLVLERGPRRRGPRRRDHESFEGEGPVVERRARRIGLGGDGWVWSGGVVDFESLDFEETAWRGGWPIDRVELAPYLESARRDLEVGPLRAVTHRSDVISMKPIARSRVRFGAIPPGVEVWLSSRVSHIVVNGSRVDHIVVVDRDGETSRVYADVCVVAAGGLESAMLLTRSDLPVGSELLGRFFADHPYLTIPISLPDDRHIPEQVGSELLSPPNALMVLSEEFRRSEQVPGAALFFVPHRDPAIWNRKGVIAWQGWAWAQRNGELPPAPASLALRSVLGVGSMLRALSARRWGWADPAVRVVVEPIPNAEGRVTDSGIVGPSGVRIPHVEWPLGAHEPRSLQALLAGVAGIAADEGWGPVGFPKGVGWPQRVESGAHHMGATRMGSNPSLGVVDVDCRVFGMDDLYVAGPSVFPTYSYANPMLTLVSLAIRMADHLCRR